jgi:hypothetical protein
MDAKPGVLLTGPLGFSHGLSKSCDLPAAPVAYLRVFSFLRTQTFGISKVCLFALPAFQLSASVRTQKPEWLKVQKDYP